jgi:hypothetical protein
MMTRVCLCVLLLSFLSISLLVSVPESFGDEARPSIANASFEEAFDPRKLPPSWEACFIGPRPEVVLVRSSPHQQGSVTGAGPSRYNARGSGSTGIPRISRVPQVLAQILALGYLEI